MKVLEQDTKDPLGGKSVRVREPSTQARARKYSPDAYPPARTPCSFARRTLEYPGGAGCNPQLGTHGYSAAWLRSAALLNDKAGILIKSLIARIHVLLQILDTSIHIRDLDAFISFLLGGARS